MSTPFILYKKFLVEQQSEAQFGTYINVIHCNVYTIHVALKHGYNLKIHASEQIVMFRNQPVCDGYISKSSTSSLVFLQWILSTYKRTEAQKVQTYGELIALRP